MIPYATIGAGSLVIENDSVLLVSPNYGRAKGAWILPGGFVDPGESPETCAIRELKEETGQDGKIVVPFCVRFRLDPADVYWVYKVTRTADLPLVAQTDELFGVQFWSVQDALNSELVRPLTKYFLRAASDDSFDLTLPEPFSKTDSAYFIK